MAEFNKIKTFDEIMQEFPTAKFNEFSNLVELARKFGNQAVLNKLTQKPSNKLSEKEIFELLARGVQHYNQTFNEELKLLETRLSTHQQPRAIPSLSEKQKLENEKQGPSKSQNYREMPSWLQKIIEEAADPKARNAALDEAAKNIANNPKSFTEQFSNVVKAEAQYRLALKMAPKLAPGYQPPKPRPQ